MPWFDLLSPTASHPPAAATADEARHWLGGQSQTVPARMLAALAEEFEAQLGTPPAALDFAAILDALRNAAITARSGATKRFAFQARPLGGEAAALFAGCARMWTAQAAGYLACAEQFGNATPRDPVLFSMAAHRALVALRLCFEDHYLAGVEIPLRLWKNAHRLVQVAHALGVASTPVADPEYRDPAETTIAEQYATIVLTALADPYSLSDPEFTVARRSFGRWRNLPTLAAARDDDPRARWIPLADLPALPPPLSAATPQWFDIGGVRSRLRKRIRNLDEGQTPEELSFGRDLSARACRDLLEKLTERLRPAAAKARPLTPRNEAVRLAVENEDCFELIAGRPLYRDRPVSADSDRLTHDRMAIFGAADSTGKNASRVGEPWTLVGESIDEEDLARPAEQGKARHLPGQLLAIGSAKGAILGVTDRVIVDSEGTLHLRARRFPGQPKAWPARSAGTGGPLTFVLYALPAVEAIGAPATLVLPSGFAIRIKQAIFCEGGPGPLYLGPLVERGNNYERYQPGSKQSG